eukprot:5258349-Prymnesium_polylepis.2
MAGLGWFFSFSFWATGWDCSVMNILEELTRVHLEDTLQHLTLSAHTLCPRAPWVAEWTRVFYEKPSAAATGGGTNAAFRAVCACCVDEALRHGRRAPARDAAFVALRCPDSTTHSRAAFDAVR